MVQEGAYYRDASSIDPLIKVKIPLFAIHARDDPIVNDLAAPYEEITHTKYAVMAVVSGEERNLVAFMLTWFQSTDPPICVHLAAMSSPPHCVLQ